MPEQPTPREVELLEALARATAENERAREKDKEQRAQIEQQRVEIKLLREKIDLLVRKIFGAQSEKQIGRAHV